MKSPKLLLIAGAVVFLYIGAGVWIFAPKDLVLQENWTPRRLSVATNMRPGEPDMARYEGAVIPDSALPQAKMPTLRIGEKEDPNVYLQSLDIKVEVTGNIASTRYTMVFRNNTDRQLEGELTFPLPDGRTATHYALDINGRMRDAVPVEKARATQVFEEIQQREVDPGVLEKVEGNNYRTRIYPFPRMGTRTISIGYEEELSLENGLLYYRLPMAYPGALKNFSVTATVWNSGHKPLVPAGKNIINFDKTGDSYVAAFTNANYRPERALVFALPAPVNAPQVMMQPAQGSYYFLASVAPRQETRKKVWGDELAVIWDVSLSGSQRNLEYEMKVLDVIFADKKNASVHLYFLNNRLTKIADKNSADGEYKVSGGNWGGLRKVLETAVFDGGTDFSQVNLNNIKGDEIIFFSDGLSTLSEADFLKKTSSGRPIHTVVSSAMADYSVMKLIAGKTKGKFVNLNASSYDRLKDELLNETLQFLGVEHGANVRDVHPGIATPVQGNFSIAGISAGNNTELTLLFGFGNKAETRMTVGLDAKTAASQGNVYRIWAQKKIEELDLDFDKNRAELTELGKQFGIVTRNTSLIVLETMEDYVRFSIEPPASEPEMRAEYQRRRKSRESDMRDTERNMLAAAVSTAQAIKKWSDTKYVLPAEPKYPVPDNRQASAGSGREITFRSSSGKSVPRPDNLSSSEPSAAESLTGVNIMRGGKSKNKGSRSRRYEPVTDFFEALPKERVVPLLMTDGDDMDDKRAESPSDMRRLSPSPGSGAMGGGDPRARVTQMGVLGIVSGQIKGSSTASADIFGKGGFANDIDAILSGVGGLKSGGDGGTGRMGVAGIGYGSGYGSGLGGSGGGIDNLMSGLSGGSGSLELKKRGELNDAPGLLRSGSLTGGRSRAGIQRIIMQNMAAMRHAYSRRTKDKPGLCGTVTVKFAIDESGKVTNARITSSSMPDSILEAAVVSWVRSYVFESIDKPGDVTEVTYPFTFTNDYCNPNITSQATAADIERWKRDEERWKKAQNAAAERKERWRREDERWRIETDRRMAEEARRRKKAEYERLKKLAEFAAPPYIQALTGNADADYQLYLMLRDNNANSPKFYFDMAGWFHDLGDTETALRILTSIAELEIESAPLYRMLGYRLKEYGEYTLQKFVCGKVLEWRPLEPQSYRDYALALADNGEHQAALDSLYGLLIRDYSAHIGRGSSGIEEVVITEINRLITQNPRLSMSKIDRRLRMEMPLDVRVALNWNHNNTNIDLIVEDPLGNISIFNNSRSNYSSGAVPTGGRMSADNSRGYGPEQFMLKKAVKGKYSIYAAYRSAREFAADGPVTVMAEVYTKYGTKDEQRAVVTMQLAREHFAWNNWGRWTAQSSEKILIGEFEL